MQSQLDRHMREHKKEEDGLFECRHCQLEVQNMAALKEHMQTHIKVRYASNPIYCGLWCIVDLHFRLCFYVHVYVFRCTQCSICFTGPTIFNTLLLHNFCICKIALTSHLRWITCTLASYFLDRASVDIADTHHTRKWRSARTSTTTHISVASVQRDLRSLANCNATSGYTQGNVHLSAPSARRHSTRKVPCSCMLEHTKRTDHSSAVTVQWDSHRRGIWEPILG